MPACESERTRNQRSSNASLITPREGRKLQMSPRGERGLRIASGSPVSIASEMPSLRAEMPEKPAASRPACASTQRIMSLASCSEHRRFVTTVTPPGPATRPREGGMVPRSLPPAATALRSPHAERGRPCRATSWASEQCRRSCPGASHRWPMSQDHCSVRCVSFLRRTMCNEQRRARPFKSPAHRSRSSGPTTDRTLAAVPPHTP